MAVPLDDVPAMQGSKESLMSLYIDYLILFSLCGSSFNETI